MATQIGGPYQDPEFNVKTNGFSVGGKSNAFKAQKKGGLGGRKPLGEISNIKASQNQAVKKNPVNNKGLLSQVKEEEKVKIRGRKPLGDISNFRKPSSLVASSNKKLSNSHLDIRDEGFLHNHKKCIKAQSFNNYEDMDYFLETIGLAKDSSVGLTCSAGHPSPKKVEPGSPLMLSELEMAGEIQEMLLDNQSPRSEKLWLELESSPLPCTRPKSPSLSYNDNWIDYECPEFMLKESPIARKP